MSTESQNTEEQSSLLALAEAIFGQGNPFQPHVVEHSQTEIEFKASDFANKEITITVKVKDLATKAKSTAKSTIVVTNQAEKVSVEGDLNIEKPTSSEDMTQGIFYTSIASHMGTLLPELLNELRNRG